jgi:hypothetical protein
MSNELFDYLYSYRSATFPGGPDNECNTENNFYVYPLHLSLLTQLCCSSTQRRRAFAGRHVFVLASCSGLRGHKRTYLTILESADRALFKMVRYVLLRPLRPELDAKTKTCLPAKTRFCHLDEQAKYQLARS